MPPDSVRVWRGFRRDDVPQEAFFAKLGSFFMPGTVQIQAPVGLTAYLPSVMPADRPDGAPDEIAIVFYEYQDAYHEAKETVGGRAYSDLHGVAFDLGRSLSGFPSLFDGELEPDGRYHLFEQPVDWQFGAASAFVGVPSGDDQDFLGDFAGWLREVQQQGSHGPDGAIAAAAEEYLVYWEHWRSHADATRSLIPRLREMVQPVYDQAIAPYALPQGVWDPFPGVVCRGGESFNFQFQRRSETG